MLHFESEGRENPYCCLKAVEQVIPFFSGEGSPLFHLHVQLTV